MKKGLYKHFKGTIYKVIGTAKDSETLEIVVIYQNLKNENEVWVRPLSNFLEKVIRDGYEMNRFEFIGE